MKIGFLFPGQGAQSIGMGKDLFENYEIYRNVYKKVQEITGINVENITFNETEETLAQTKNTQICILRMSLAILEVLKKEEIKAEISMGLSLGEYSALMYSGAISFEDGVKIVQKRGKIMQEKCPQGNWSMAAIMGLEAEKISKICNSITTSFVSPVNYNCPGQIVISGKKDAIDKAMEIAKQEGAKKVVELKTSGPFHTKILKQASEELEKELESIEISNFKTKVIKNIDGKLYKDNDNVKEILTQHIINPVKFDEGIKTMLNMGIDTFVEIGPGKTLSGFVKRTSKEVNILNINSVDTLKNTINFTKKERNV